MAIRAGHLWIRRFGVNDTDAGVENVDNRGCADRGGHGLKSICEER